MRYCHFGFSSVNYSDSDSDVEYCCKFTSSIEFIDSVTPV